MRRRRCGGGEEEARRKQGMMVVVVVWMVCIFSDMIWMSQHFQAASPLLHRNKRHQSRSSSPAQRRRILLFQRSGGGAAFFFFLFIVAAPPAAGRGARRCAAWQRCGCCALAGYAFGLCCPGGGAHRSSDAQAPPARRRAGRRGTTAHGRPSRQHEHHPSCLSAASQFIDALSPHNTPFPLKPIMHRAARLLRRRMRPRVFCSTQRDLFSYYIQAHRKQRKQKLDSQQPAVNQPNEEHLPLARAASSACQTPPPAPAVAPPDACRAKPRRSQRRESRRCL